MISTTRRGQTCRVLSIRASINRSRASEASPFAGHIITARLQAPALSSLLLRRLPLLLGVPAPPPTASSPPVPIPLSVRVCLQRIRQQTRSKVRPIVKVSGMFTVKPVWQTCVSSVPDDSHIADSMNHMLDPNCERVYWPKRSAGANTEPLMSRALLRRRDASSRLSLGYASSSAGESAELSVPESRLGHGDVASRSDDDPAPAGSLRASPDVAYLFLGLPQRADEAPRRRPQGGSMIEASSALKHATYPD